MSEFQAKGDGALSVYKRVPTKDHSHHLLPDVCRQCKTWRKKQYWTDEHRSNKHRFFKILLGDYKNELRIPRKFMSEFKGELLSEVNLRGPSGNVWTTKLVREEEDVFLQHGWEVFAKNHGLNKYDFLVFEYSAKSCFDVLIFDPTGCENEGSYYADRNLKLSTKHCCSIREAVNPHTNVNEAQMLDEGDESLNRDVFLQMSNVLRN